MSRLIVLRGPDRVIRVKEVRAASNATSGGRQLAPDCSACEQGLLAYVVQGNDPDLTIVCPNEAGVCSALLCLQLLLGLTPPSTETSKTPRANDRRGVQLRGTCDRRFTAARTV